jgi:hypothetical protein
MMTVFWDVATCSLVELNRSFRGAYYLHHQGDLSQWAHLKRRSSSIRLHGATSQKTSSYSLTWEPKISPVIVIDRLCNLDVGHSCRHHSGDLHLTPAWPARKTHNNTMEVPVKCFPHINLFIILQTLEGRYGGEGDELQTVGAEGVKICFV